jgi:hypothetical protein
MPSPDTDRGGALDIDCSDEPATPIFFLPTAPGFSRGDVDGDGNLTMNDAIHVLKWNLLGSEDLVCLDAADADDDGDLTLGDASYSLSFNFLGTAAPPAPFTSCDADVTPDVLGCQEYEACADPSVTAPDPVIIGSRERR